MIVLLISTFAQIIERPECFVIDILQNKKNWKSVNCKLKNLSFTNVWALHAWPKCWIFCVMCRPDSVLRKQEVESAKNMQIFFQYPGWFGS